MQSGYPEYERSQRKSEQQQRGRLWNCRRGGKETMSAVLIVVSADDLTGAIDPVGLGGGCARKGHVDRAEGSAVLHKPMFPVLSKKCPAISPRR